VRIAGEVQHCSFCTGSAVHSLLSCEAEQDAFTTELGRPALDISALEVQRAR